MKRTCCFILTVIFILSCCSFSAYADEETCKDTYTIYFHNSAMESNAMRSVNNPKEFKTAEYLSQASKQINASGLNVEMESVREVIEDASSNADELLMLKVQNVYYKAYTLENEQFGEIIDKTEYNAEKNKLIAEQNATASTKGHIGTYTDYVGELQFIVSLSTTTYEDREIAYYLGATAVWSEYTTDGENHPARGDDAVCFSWGGGLNKSAVRTSLTALDGTALSANPIAAESNKSCGWSFVDYETGHADKSLKRGVFGATITKNHAADEYMEIYASYIHTYDDVDWNFGVGVNIANGRVLPGGVSISPARETNFWQSVINIMNVPY